MKFQGSKVVCLFCLECGEISKAFRVYLFEEDGEDLFDSKQYPEGWWLLNEDAELMDGQIGAYCPNHRQEMPE